VPVLIVLGSIVVQVVRNRDESDVGDPGDREDEAEPGDREPNPGPGRVL
jgi:hypothetical protein